LEITMTSTNETASPLTDAIAQLNGQDGNAFGILGRVRRAILASNRPDLADEFMREATSRDYEHLLATCSRYVTVE
jgi:hypothetical protein